MKTKLLVIFLLILAHWSCKKIERDTDEYIPLVKFSDSILITKTNFISKTGNKLYFDIEAVSLKNGYTHTDFHDTAFNYYSQPNPAFSVDIQSVDRGVLQQNDTYDVIVLIDLSEIHFSSWIGPSFLDNLSKLVRICNESPNKNIAVGYYARNVDGNNQVLFCKNPVTGGIFDNDNQQIFDFLATNFSKVGLIEKSSMQDAINVSIDKLLEFSTASKKSIVLVNGNEDDGQSSISKSQLIQKCRANSVNVNYINWGQNYCSYLEIAMETGGFYGAANTITEFTSFLYSIDELLSKNYNYYTLHCLASRPQSWVANNSLCYVTNVHYFKPVFSPYFQEALYSDYDIDTGLPIFLKVQ